MEWKPITGFEEYLVSDTGIIVSLPRNYKYGTINQPIALKQDINKGYSRVTLHKNGRKYKRQVHRLVAEAFIPNPNNYPCVNHKDECPANNSVSNLEWCTYKYNANYGNRNRKIQKGVRQYSIDGTFIKEWDSLSEASSALKLSWGGISKCIHEKQKIAGGYKWQRVQ